MFWPVWATLGVAASSLACGCDDDRGPLRVDGRTTATWVAELAETSRDASAALEAVGLLGAEIALTDLAATDVRSADRVRGAGAPRGTPRVSGRPTDTDRVELERARPRLVALAREPRGDVRGRALCNLATIGTLPGPEEEVLRQAIGDASVPIRTCALLAAARFRGTSATLAEPIAAATRDPAFRVRSTALLALGQVASDTDRYLGVFETALDDPNLVIRMVAADTIREDLAQRARPLATNLRDRLTKAENDLEAESMRRAIEAVDQASAR